MTFAKTVLGNGVTILSEYLPYLRSATVGVWISLGSRAESIPENGICHFIEHMLFKGTARRRALDISREIESVGGTMNAYTDREFLFFFGKVLTKDFPLVADLLSDIYLNSLFDAKELDREKDVVLQEILMVEDNPEDLLHDFFHESYWGGHPLGLPIQGTSGNVAAFTRERVTEYFRDRFWRRGVIISVGGNVPHERVVGEFEAASPVPGRPRDIPRKRVAVRGSRPERDPGGEHEQPALPGDPRETRPRLFRFLLPLLLRRHGDPENLRGNDLRQGRGGARGDR
jgi:predicted Zn-dependent peptidase